MLTRIRSLSLAALAGLVGWFTPAMAQPTAPTSTGPGFTVRPGAVADAGALGEGRVVVYLIAPDAKVNERSRPADAPFYEDPQPLYGIDVNAVTDWANLRLTDANAAGFPGPRARCPRASIAPRRCWTGTGRSDPGVEKRATCTPMWSGSPSARTVRGPRWT